MEDLYTAQIAQESEQGELAQLFKKPLAKIKDTLPQLFVESDEGAAPVQIASATLFPFSEGAVVVKAEPEVVTIDADAVQVAPAVHVEELNENAVVQFDIVRDWAGLILMPDGIKLAQAYTSNVHLHRVEAHPIDGGRLLVWSRIQSSRRFYNGNVREYRNKTQSFPSNIVAGMFGFPPEAEEFFEVESVEREAVKVSF